MSSQDSIKNKLKEWLSDERSAALVTSAVSLRYLCGFEVRGGMALVSKEAALLYVCEAETERASRKAAGFDVVELYDIKQVLDDLVKYGIKKIYIESDKVTASQLGYFRDKLHYAEILPTDGLSDMLMTLRTVKSEAEIKAVQKAQTVCDKAYQRLLGTVRKGMTERQTAAYLTYYLTEYGADEPAFPVKALSGERSAKIGARSGERKLTEGDFLVLEFGAKVGGYCASMARTIAVGAISSKQEDAYNAVNCALMDGLKVMRGGIGAKVCESVARATLNAWSLEKYAAAGFGHGIGLEAEEPPLLRLDSTLSLKAGMTLTAGCGIAAKDRFGIKIADCVTVTAEGCESFTAATKSLLHI